jgi:4-hydroxy-2-oxoglutarate aldolase
MNSANPTAFDIASLQGVLLPITTPFGLVQQLDLRLLQLNIRKWRSSGILGFVLLGSTGERVHVDEKEFLQIIECARAEVPQQMRFIVGAGQQSTMSTISEVRNVARAGAEAVLVITPCFYRAAIDQEALINYYTAVAEAATIPVLLYSMPALTGIKIEPETIARLSEHPNIIGVKDSSNDMSGFSQTIKLCPADFAVMTGNGTVLLDALKYGATGGILAVGCAVPEICVDLFRAFRAGELEKAEALQTKLTPFAAAVTTRFGIGGLKAALDLAGYQGGMVRAPLRAPTEAQRAEIATLFEEVQATFAELAATTTGY